VPPFLSAVVFTALSCLLPVPHELAAAALGITYGPGLGSAIMWTGAVLGAGASYELARWGSGRTGLATRLEARWPVAWRRLAAATGWQPLLGMRLLPAIPFVLINYGAGVVGIPRGRFYLTTAFGVVPGVIGFTAGSWWIHEHRGRWGLAVALALIVGVLVARAWRGRRQAALPVAMAACCLSMLPGRAAAQDPQAIAVLVHGCQPGGRASDWLPLRQRLEAVGVTVLAPDLPGYGASPRPQIAANGDNAEWMRAWRAGWRPLVDSLAAVLRDRERASPATRIALVGAGCGGYFALLLAEQASPRGVVTLSGMAEPDQLERLTSAGIPMLAGVARGDRPAVVDRIAAMEAVVPHLQLVRIAGSAHGTALVTTDARMLATVAGWLESVLDTRSSPPAPSAGERSWRMRSRYRDM
jgi:uncharacterized membrane protein YdjX (TVP38/TMEM64 family)/dienelactone hydrolase